MNSNTTNSTLDPLLRSYAEILYVPTQGIRGVDLYSAWQDFYESDFMRFAKLSASDKLAVVWMYSQIEYRNIKLRKLTQEERVRFQPDELFQTANPERCKNYAPYLDFIDLVATEK